MKILYVVADRGISIAHATGAATHILSVIRGLEGLNIRVRTLIGGDLYSCGRAMNKTSFLRAIFPPVLATVKRDIGFLLHERQWLKRVKEEIEGFRPDIVYERATFFHAGVGLLCGELGIPIVMEINSPLDEFKFMGGSLLLPLAMFKEKRNLSLASAIITVSDAMKDYLIARGADPLKVYVIRNAADKEMFRAIGPSNNKKPDSEIILGHVSSFANWYRIDILIRAFALVNKIYPKARLFIIGDGPSRNKLEILVGKLDISDSIIFMGKKPQNEALDILAGQVDIAISTNISWYGSPTKIFEYGMLGKPVIAFRTRAISEVIRHGENGLLTSVDPDGLAQAIIRLMNEPEFRVSLAKNLQAKVSSDYTWHAVASRTAAICEKITADMAIKTANTK